MGPPLLPPPPNPRLKAPEPKPLEWVDDGADAGFLATLRRWWRHPLHRWVIARDAGATLYFVCRVCGKRAISASPYSYQPIDWHWLATGVWWETLGPPRPTPPPPAHTDWSRVGTLGIRSAVQPPQATLSWGLDHDFDPILRVRPSGAPVPEYRPILRVIDDEPPLWPDYGEGGNDGEGEDDREAR